MSGYKVVPVESTPKDAESVWMYKGNDGEWKPFMNEQHRLNTIADGGWDVREFFADPIVQGEPVAITQADHVKGETGYCEFLCNLPHGTRLYSSPQPAEQQPVYQRCEYCDGTGDVHSIDGEWRGACDCQQPAPSAPTFQLGDHVRKTKGSQWKGRVVGTYSTTLTPEGYAVESDTERGSVQIYPVGALELAGEDDEPDVAGLVEALDRIANLPMNYCSTENDYRLSAAKAIALAAVGDFRDAAHRKQGGGHV